VPTMTSARQWPTSRLRAAFVMEQALGHVTHYRNLRSFADTQIYVQPTWLPIDFKVEGPTRLLPFFSTNWSVRASWRARRALDAVDARNSFDALFFHTQVTSLFSIGLMSAVPTLISMDATPINYDTLGWEYGHRPAGDGPVDRQKYRLNRRAFHAAVGLVTWSEWARRSLIDDYEVPRDKIRVITPGASPTFFEIGQARVTAPHRDKNDHMQLLFVGGDFQRKGGQMLLELMRGPLGELCDLHLVTGANVPAQRNVFVYRGVQPNSDELRRLFSNADMFLFPTFADCLPVALQEAAAAGLPAIATNVGALPESITDRGTGLVVPPGDGRALQAAVESLLVDQGRRVQMGRAAHALACRRFDARYNNQVLLDFLREVANSSHSMRRAA